MSIAEVSLNLHQCYTDSRHFSSSDHQKKGLRQPLRSMDIVELVLLRKSVRGGVDRILRVPI